LLFECSGFSEIDAKSGFSHIALIVSPTGNTRDWEEITVLPQCHKPYPHAGGVAVSSIRAENAS
jgi:hypothetical protein